MDRTLTDGEVYKAIRLEIMKRGEPPAKGERLVIDVNGERAVDRSVGEIESAWRGVLPGMLELRAED